MTNAGAHFSHTGKKLLAANIVLAALYFAASKLGLAFAFPVEQVTAVWPPTGIALAAVLIRGNRILPGIVAGAFLANITSHEPLSVALCIAAGNTLEAWAGAAMIRRFGSFSNSLAQARDVLSIIIFSAVCSTMLSATIGVLSLCEGGVQPWGEYSSLWMLWWLGDATGALIVAPALLVWSGKAHQHMRQGNGKLELVLLLCGLAAACAAIFIQAPAASMRGQIFLNAIFIFVIWAGLRYGQRGTTLVTLACCASAVLFTISGQGPFVADSVNKSLILLQAFMAMVAMTGLFLGAVITELTHATLALEVADRRKNEFIAMLAHELRGPLAPLANALQIVKLPGIGNDRVSEAHALMQRQLQQINRLVDDLLDVTRITQGKIELRMERVALKDVVMNALEVCKPSMQAGRHRLSVRLPQEQMFLNGDAGRLTQIFINLLGNAAKYTPAGGVVAIEAASKNTGSVFLRVSDNGIGIPASLMPHIFELFTQGDYSSERSQGGLGIGLTLVKKLVELHGGTISAASGGAFKGSEFTVTLPLEATYDFNKNESASNMSV